VEKGASNLYSNFLGGIEMKVPFPSFVNMDVYSVS
jgi:hypothetical protein